MTSDILGAAGRFLITSGIVVLLFVGYQLWGTGLQEAAAQGELDSEFDDLIESLEATPAATTTAPTTSAAPQSTSTSTSTTTTTLPPAGGTIPVSDVALAEALYRDGGEAVARIAIPQIGLEKVVVEGVKVEDLRNGPGHYRATVFPGQRGNSGIAGHRTTYGAPFNRIDELAPGDELEVETVQGVHTYRVMSAAEAFAPTSNNPNVSFAVPDDGAQLGHIIVGPDATWVLGNFGDNRLTLTACHPKYSARERIIVAAELVSDPVDSPPLPAEFTATEDSDLSNEKIADVAEPEDAAGVPLEESTQGNESPQPGADPTATPNVFDEVSLDEGLNGDKSALFPAIGWGVATMAAWFGFKELSRRWRRWPAILLGVVPVTLLLGLCFEKIDRYLPAG